MDDRELMLWALSHGWVVHMLEGSEGTGASWISPTGSRFGPVDAGPWDTDLPAINDEMRKRMAAERTRRHEDKVAGRRMSRGHE